MTTTPIAARTVDRFLDAACRGTGVPQDLFAAEVVLDATVPGWRFTVKGPEAVARQYSGWFAHAGVLEELERWAISDGEVLTYLQTWEEGGIPHAAHHCHVLRFDAEGRIAGDHFFCGGVWDAARLAEMAAASDAG